jgi:hypothetical protein
MALPVRRLCAKGGLDMVTPFPLSPLLFAIVADLMQEVINHENHLGNLLPPFPQNAELPFPII